MKLRDKILYMSFGAMLVVLGMVLNSLISGNVNAQVDMEDAIFETVECEDAIFGNIVITDDVACRNLAILDVDEGEAKALLGLDTNGNGRLVMYGDDSNYPIAYLGENEKTNEMILQLQSKSKIDKRQVYMHIDKNSGTVGCLNKIGKNVVGLGIADDGGGLLDRK